MKKRRALWLLLSVSFVLFSGLGYGGEKATGKKIHGGKNYESATPLELNRDYQLDHHQKKGEFDYFSIPAEPDTIVTLEVRTFEKGISWNKTRRVTTTEPFAGLQLQDDKKTLLRSVDIDSTPNMVQSASFRNRNPKVGTYYVLVGNSQGSIHKDHMMFKVTASPFTSGDLGTNQDAGSSAEEAMPMLVAQHYPINSIGGG